MALSPLNARRLNNFKKNRRAVWSLWIFTVLFGLSLFAEFLANDKPILVSYRGEFSCTVTQFYSETVRLVETLKQRQPIVTQKSSA